MLKYYYYYSVLYFNQILNCKGVRSKQNYSINTVECIDSLKTIQVCLKLGTAGCSYLFLDNRGSHVNFSKYGITITAGVFSYSLGRIVVDSVHKIYHRMLSKHCLAAKQTYSSEKKKKNSKC